MTRANRQAHGRWSALIIAMVAFAVAACGSTNPEPVPTAAATSAPPSPSVSPSSSATASPSATASTSPSGDLGKLVIDRMSRFDFYAKSVIAGEFQAGTGRYEISGALDIAGQNSHQLLDIHVPGQAAQETLTVSGTTYARTGAGPWYAKPPSVGPSGVNGFLGTLKTLQDAGVESKNGKELHHLILPAGTVMPPAALGLTDPSITGAHGSIEVWAEADGTVAVLGAEATWQQKNASGVLIDVAMAFEFTFSNVGMSFTIEAPEQTWTTYASALNHMSFGYPDDWDLIKAKGKIKYDEAAGPDAAYADAWRYAARGFTLNQLARAIASNPDKLKGFRVNSTKTVKMAGLTGRQMLIHATVQGRKRYWIFTFVLKGSYFYEIDLFDDAGHEKDDLALANLFVTTVAIK